MSGIQMNPQDLLELYQLIRLYEGTYADSGAVDEKYKERTGGEDIGQAGNPRGAGRKKKYTEKENEKILELRKKGDSLRRISRETGCSAGHVQDVIKACKRN